MVIFPIKTQVTPSRNTVSLTGPGMVGSCLPPHLTSALSAQSLPRLLSMHCVLSHWGDFTPAVFCPPLQPPALTPLPLTLQSQLQFPPIFQPWSASLAHVLSLNPALFLCITSLPLQFITSFVPLFGYVHFSHQARKP